MDKQTRHVNQLEGNPSTQASTSFRYPAAPQPAMPSMSDTSTNTTRRMTTRGGAKEKMSKVVAMVRSGGIAEESDHEDNVAAKSNTKKSKSKVSGVGRGAKNMTKKLALASELRQRTPGTGNPN